MAKKNTKRQYRDNLLQRFTKQKRRNVMAKPGLREVVIILDGLKPNYNIGKIFRSADAFGIEKIHLIGIEMFDPAPAKGSFRYVPAVFDASFAETYRSLSEEGYTFVAFTLEGDISLQEIQLPQKSAFVFGHEEFGFSFELDDYPNLRRVHIEQIGRVESLNVSVAASIAMYEYGCQHPAREKR